MALNRPIVNGLTPFTTLF